MQLTEREDSLIGEGEGEEEEGRRCSRRTLCLLIAFSICSGFLWDSLLLLSVIKLIFLDLQVPPFIGSGLGQVNDLHWKKKERPPRRLGETSVCFLGKYYPIHSTGNSMLSTTLFPRGCWLPKHVVSHPTTVNISQLKANKLINK